MNINQSNYQTSFYNPIIMGYLNSLPNSGVMNIDGKSVFMAESGSQRLGTKIKLYIKINNAIIERVKYLVYGDGYIIAALGAISEELPGLSIKQLANYSFNKTIEKLVMPAAKINDLKNIKQALDNIVCEYSKLNKK